MNISNPPSTYKTHKTDKGAIRNRIARFHMRRKVLSPIVMALMIFTLSALANTATAQQLLNKTLSLSVNQQPLDEALEILSNKGGFFFSYNSHIIKKDSIVTLTMTNRSVQDILSALLGNHYEFKESGNYIIIRRAPIRLRLVTSAAVNEDKFYVISGYVIDDQTGEKISDASVYEKDRLIIANTNELGFFKLRLRSRYPTASITVSKEYYEDTTVVIQPKFNQSVTITLSPSAITEHTVIIGPTAYAAPDSIRLEIPISDSASWLYTYIKKDSALVEKTTLGKWFVSSSQRLQSLNLKRFFTQRPYQVSVVPHISTNGRLNSQVVNNFSFNIFGGYSGGVNGFELGGLFNIDKKDAAYVQIAGLFNMVGGHSTGLQIGGISNTVLDTVSGLQIGGVSNFTKDKFSGAQIGGIYNHVGATMDGAQIAGIANFTNHSAQGAQIAGIANFSSREVRGVQIAGIFNYTRHLKGAQIGLINVSDSSDGYSIGLINIVMKGYHKLAIYTNEMMNANIAFKTGNTKLYSIFLGGYNAFPDKKVWSYGYGLGSELTLVKKLALNIELSSQYLYLGSWDHLNLQNKVNALLNLRLSKIFSIYAGPAYSVFVSNQHEAVGGYKDPMSPTGHKTHDFGGSITRCIGWLGWTAGIHLF